MDLGSYCPFEYSVQSTDSTFDSTFNAYQPVDPGITSSVDDSGSYTWSDGLSLASDYIHSAAEDVATDYQGMSETLGRVSDDFAVQAAIEGDAASDTLRDLQSGFKSAADDLHVTAAKAGAVGGLAEAASNVLTAIDVKDQMTKTWEHGHAHSEPGRVIDTALTGGVTGLVGSNKVLGTVDTLTHHVISDFYRSGAHALVGLGETIAGDPSAAADFTAASKSGEYGVVSQEISQATDYWMDNGLQGGMEKAWNGATQLFE